MANDNYENLGFQVKVDGADSAVSNLDRIIQRLEKINQLQGKKVSTSKQVISAQKQEEKQLKRNTQSLTSYLGKLTSTVVIARKFARVISSAIQESANYVENLNLFAVAYGDVYKETLDWALNLADSFGLANNEVVKFAGTFRQLSTSLGLVEDTANSVSKTVTQLGYDMSALFNTTVENAMEKLQSGLFSGNVRPLRAYGIDISQNQIDALFETNQALASLGVNARNLSQSDKVLARLIITLRDGSNAFGTMNREINTLQSQIRILQGSFSNFKLAIGDLVYEPTRQALVMLNAFIIAATNVIRILAPLKKTDENNVFNGVAMGAEEANEQIDELNGKLATFDKFNVLGGQSQGGTSSAITEALTAELAKQQEYYKQQVALMDDIENEAKELAEVLEPVVIALGGISLGISAIKFVGLGGKGNIFANLSTAILECATSTKGLTTQTTLLGKAFTFIQTHPIIAVISAVIGLMVYLYSTNEDFRNSVNKLLQALSPLINLLSSLVGDILSSLGGTLEALVSIIAKIATFIVKIVNVGVIMIEAFLIPFVVATEIIIKSLQTIFELLASIVSFDFSNFAKNIKNIWSNWASADFVVSMQGLGFENGGYTNANLIMTHENGKREWVGKAAGSSAIVNDTQMSDIMETAVAKGVYRAMSSSRTDGGSGGTTKNVYNFQVNGRTLLSVMEDEARKQGKTLQRI